VHDLERPTNLPHVPRDQIVAAAMNALWIGFERVLDGERWTPPDA
jgi:hypothetical protein